MKNSDPSLERLLRAAAQYRLNDRANQADAAPPFGFATRVIAGWKSGARDGSGLETLWFRRAFLCAMAVAVASVGWSYKTDTAAPDDEVAIASYDASVDLP